MELLDYLADADLGVSQAAFAAFATTVTVLLVFVVTPTRASLYWSFAFTLAMVSSFGVVAGQTAGNETLRAFSLGLLLGAPALLWSGFRALRGVRPWVWTGPVLSLVAAVALALVADGPWFAPAYRVMYLLAAVTAGLFVWEWRRLDQRRDPSIWPLGVVSILFVLLGIATVVVGLVRPTEEGFALTRPLASIGMLVYIGCALVAVIGVGTRSGGSFGRPDTRAAQEWRRFRDAVSNRLSRAEATGETCSLISLRLDDAAELRAAMGPVALSRLNRELGERVRTTVQPPALVGLADGGEIVLFVPLAEGLVRDLLRRLLRETADLDPEGRIAVQPSASAGWSTTSVAGYDFEALLFIARGAVRVAQLGGGDQWERADGTLIERLVTGLERR